MDGALNPTATHISLSSSETWLNWDLRQKAKQRAELTIENSDLFWTYSITRYCENKSTFLVTYFQIQRTEIIQLIRELLLCLPFSYAALRNSVYTVCAQFLVPTPFYVFAHHIINSSKRPWLVPRWHGFEVRFSLHLLMETQLKQLVLSLYVSNSD